ncbi:DLA class II histocompatibility antigen, DR-1 beta chain-like [Terrapene carolina triunguis]|uniref:DLA class II histocompatibility antigen, DR-1 beta chain-like n=1 Tax=Terrapene triunguis TaxID=2587831 RepID=UPI000CEF736A|nr:DLA class II histocompatibility antigen, DR-1 beta chain-like [Terrapene carolina triunguis]
MAPGGVHPALVSTWLLFLCSVVSAGVHRFTHSQIISPQAAPGLPKRQSLLQVNGLALSAYDSSSRRMMPRNGYMQGDRETHQFWSVSSARCMFWDPWVETEYQALVRAVNASSPKAEPYYMQVVQSCELDEASGAVRAVTRYALNGEDVLQYHGDQNRWFSVHPAAWRVAERWNRERETLAGINAHTPQQCGTFIRITSPFTAQTTAQPTVHVSLVRGTRGQPHRLMCHVTGFYPRDIEVTWERGGKGALGEQMTSRIRPNGDPTFQIRVSIELGLGEHVCVVRHVSLGGAPLRITWDPQATGQAGSLGVLASCVLAALGVAALGWYLRGRPGRLEGPFRSARAQPGTLDSALAKPGDTLATSLSCPGVTA